MLMGQGQPIQGGGMGGQQQMTSGGPTAMPSGYHQPPAGPRSASMATSYQASSVTVMSKGQPMTLCKVCQKQPANPGHTWCQTCYANKS